MRAISGGGMICRDACNYVGRWAWLASQYDLMNLIPEKHGLVAQHRILDSGDSVPGDPSDLDLLARPSLRE